MTTGTMIMTSAALTAIVATAVAVNTLSSAPTRMQPQGMIQINRVPVAVHEGKLDYTTTARALSEVCKDLEVALSVTISPRGQAAKEPVVVHVTDVTLDDLLNRLAEATSCEVLRSDSGYVVERAVALDRKLKDQYFEHRLRAVKEGYKQLEKVLEFDWKRESLVAIAKERFKPDSYEEGVSEAEEERRQERHRELYYYGPGPRALARCLQGIDPAVLARMRIGDRYVFTTTPNAMQRQIGSGARRAMAFVNKEQELWGTSLREAAGDDTDRFHEDQVIGQFGDEDFFLSASDPWARTLPFRSEPVTLRLIVGYRWYGSYEVELVGLSKEGKTAFKYETDGLFYDYEGWGGIASESNDYDVELGTVSAAWAAISGRPFEEEKQPTKEELAHNRAVVARYYGERSDADPLALLASDAFIGLAKRDSLDAVACFSDEFNTVSDLIAGTKVSTKRFEALLKAANDHVTTRDGGWLTVRPAMPEKVSLTRFDRAAFRRMMQSVHRTGVCSLDASADFFANAGETPLYNDASYIMRTVYVANIADAMGNGSVMSFYSRLTDQQRKWLGEGNTITVSQLTRDQKLWAERVVFGADNNGNVIRHYEGRATWNSDITDELPQGLRSDALIQGKQFVQTYIQFVNKAAKEFEIFWSERMEDDGMGRFWSGPPPTYPTQAEKVTEYVVRRNHRVEVRVETTPGAFIGNDVRDDLPRSEVRTVKFEDLTEAERKVVEAGWKELKSFGMAIDRDP